MKDTPPTDEPTAPMFGPVKATTVQLITAEKFNDTSGLYSYPWAASLTRTQLLVLIVVVAWFVSVIATITLSVLGII